MRGRFGAAFVVSTTTLDPALASIRRVVIVAPSAVEYERQTAAALDAVGADDREVQP